MQIKRIFLVCSILLLCNAAVLKAGDSASFVDLGFSADGSAYMFAQHGVRSGTLYPWADLFVVDIARNEFVPQGRIPYTHSKPIDAGQDGSAALYHLLTQNAGLVERHGLSYPNQGQPLYIALNGDPAYDGATITFKDFVSGISYQANLVEKISGSGKNVRSSFYITLESTGSDGEKKTYTIGAPQLERPSIFSYRIKKALAAPSGNALIFVIEMKRHGENGPDIRYMIEAVRF
jgi:predicted secreted protein